MTCIETQHKKIPERKKEDSQKKKEKKIGKEEQKKEGNKERIGEKNCVEVLRKFAMGYSFISIFDIYNF